MKDTKADAKGKWFDILSNYIDSKILDGKHHGCPLCGEGKDRFRFDDREGNGNFFCSQCGAGTGIHLLAHHQGISYSDAWKLVETVIGTAQVREEKKVDHGARIRDILATCHPGGEFVAGYLRSRHIQNAPETLMAGFYWIEGAKCQAMIAKAAKGRKLAGLHATFIRDGVKTARRMYAVERGSMMGSAIRLHKLGESDAVLLGEGIETTLSAAEIYKLPAWACMDAMKLQGVELPQQIKRVVIAADNDHSFTGQAAAYTLAKRLKLAGLSVEVVMPRTIGDDWNDYKRKIRQAESDGVANENRGDMPKDESGSN